MRGTPYPTLGELLRRARATVAARPGALRLRAVGTSRAGRPLWLLSAGHGPRHILTVAGAHANEPVGGVTSLFLAERFAREPALLQESGCTWNFLLCLDPDGASLAGRWLTGRSGERPPGEGLPGEGPAAEASPTLRGYYRRFYRPAFAAQPEFPPVASDPRPVMPESEALVRLIDELRPVVQFSLHGVEVGGSFLQLTRAVPGAAVAYRRIAADLGIPLEHRPFDGMGWLAESPGVLVLPDSSPTEERDPSGFTSQATWLYAMRHGTVSAVVEAPFWSVAGVSDPRPVAEPRREVAEASEILLGRAKQLEAVVGELGPRSPETPEEIAHFTAARELMDIGPGVVDTWNSAELATTVGNSVSLGVAARRIPLRAAAMMRQALGGAPALDTLVETWARELASTFDARWVPVADQTELQIRTMLALARALV
ncbi:M14 family zinc carboxypeptidase [Streptomyces sp. Ag82_O1-15]|uniref:M14 family zinc carboxypeptidase n=1 Tax=Streptomyces sp. Ag82_O1-15 TaxID=1938855 RepID=UPI000BB0F2D9|nr:M14 family zinc carboxypeptidase [Streptomyces sp. Ag82_O1-15]